MIALGNGELFVDERHRELIELPCEGDQTRYNLRADECPGLRIDISMIWESDYVKNGYQSQHFTGKVEVRRPGETWDFDDRPDQSIMDIDGIPVLPRTVIEDANLEFHYTVRHWVRGETFIVIATYYSSKVVPSELISAALGRLRFASRPFA